jgi:hypothetical protein
MFGAGPWRLPAPVLRTGDLAKANAMGAWAVHLGLCRPYSVLSKASARRQQRHTALRTNDRPVHACDGKPLKGFFG